jgi:iron-sulfur cluster assembly accessory protein
VLTLEEPGAQKLRIAIKGGGCAGFEYEFTPVPCEEEGDFVFNAGRARVVVDPVSAQYLTGSTLDYVQESFSAKFVLKNPNATTTCGCGKSFAG